MPVLVDFDFTIRSGEVHALVGGNGAGKSTFARILSGLEHRDGGELFLDGQAYSPGSRAEAQRAGIVMVLQELNIIPTLSVAENLFFDCLPHRWGWIRRKRLMNEAVGALERVGLGHLPPDQKVESLGIGHRQMLEIAAALARDCRILILDEPTAALTNREIDELFLRIRKLRERGVGILYISHRMEEIRMIADRVTVLRDGRVIATHPASGLDLSKVFEEMVGRKVAQGRERVDRGASGPVVLSAKGVCAEGVRDVDIEVREGEILGLAGLVGAGRTEFLRALFGASERTGGELCLDGHRIDIRTPADAVRAGIAMIPEDRKDDGLLLPQSITCNATLATHDLYSRLGWLLRNREDAAVERVGRRLDLRSAGLDQPVAELSGGNQQKVVLMRWLLRDCRVLLLDEPTRGVDMGAKETIYALLRELADNGKAILVVSSELPELLGLCDRIAVMSAGKLVAAFTPETWSEDRITEAAFSAYLNPDEL